MTSPWLTTASTNVAPDAANTVMVTNYVGVGASAVVHGLAGGIIAVAEGQNFQSGFLSAGVSALAGPFYAKNAAVAGMEMSVVGGASATLGGGKFANGAETAGFSFFFNFCNHHGCWESADERALRNAGDAEGYWNAKCNSGEPFACTALGVVRNDTILGGLANGWLRTVAWFEGVTVNSRNVSTDLMNRYGNYQEATSSPGNPRWPSASAIKTERNQTFEDFGLPPITFGGNVLQAFHVPDSTSLWCRGCAP